MASVGGFRYMNIHGRRHVLSCLDDDDDDDDDDDGDDDGSDLDDG